MIVVGHLAIGVALDAIPLDDGFENVEEPAAIDIVAVDGLLGVSARDDVIEGTCGKEAKGPGHAWTRINERSSSRVVEFRKFSKEGLAQIAESAALLWTASDSFRHVLVPHVPVPQGQILYFNIAAMLKYRI